MANKKENNNDFIIEYKGEFYRLVGNFNVLQALQEKYGSYDKWIDLVSDENEPNLEAFIFGICEMINEGIDEDNEDTDKKRDFISTKKAGRIITAAGYTDTAKKAYKALQKGAEANEKNE